MSKHTRSQYGISRLNDQFGQSDPNATLRDQDPFIIYYKTEIRNSLSYMKASGAVSSNINETQAIIKVERPNLFTLYEVLEVSISKKEGNVVKYTSEKYKFAKTSDNKYEVVIPLGEAKTLSGSESRVFNFYLLYRDNIYFSLNTNLQEE